VTTIQLDSVARNKLATIKVDYCKNDEIGSHKSARTLALLFRLASFSCLARSSFGEITESAN